MLSLSNQIRSWLEDDKSIAYVRKRAELLVLADKVAQLEAENERLGSILRTVYFTIEDALKEAK